jgi:putative aldouronate transport system permease protein
VNEVERILPSGKGLTKENKKGKFYSNSNKLRKNIKYIKKNYQLYLFFMLPPLILLIVFKYLPIGGILIAFEDYSPIQGILGSEWVGLKHFTRFLSSPHFMDLLINTLKLSLFGLLWGFPIPIILAILISRVKSERLRKNIQLIIYAPNFISVIVIAGMIILFLSPIGPINQLFGTTINFMAKPEAFRTIYIASGIWQGAGWASIIYTAALSNASKELTEAAVIDGANIFQQIWNVDIPAIKPIMVIQFILSAGSIMSIGFEKALALQTNLNLPTSEILPTYVYKMGLQMGDYSFSTAVGLFNAIINVILLIVVNTAANKLSKDDEEVQGL